MEMVNALSMWSHFEIVRGLINYPYQLRSANWPQAVLGQSDFKVTHSGLHFNETV